MSTSSGGYWQISGASALVNNQTVIANLETIIDSGTTLMYGPPADVDTFYSAIPGAEIADEEYGLYTFPCDAVPSVSFNWGGQNWDISAEK